MFKRLLSSIKGRKTQKDFDCFVRCPHCDTLYGLYHHVKRTSLQEVSCGTCANTFDSFNNQCAPRGKISVPDVSHVIPSRLSRAAHSEPDAFWVDSGFKNEEKSELPPKNTRSRPKKWLKKVSTFSLIASANALAIGGIWMNRDIISEHIPFSEWIQTVITSSTSAPVHTIVVQQHQLTADAANAQLLQLHALIQNTGATPQPLSNLEMKMDDLQGNKVNTMIFTPEQYSPADPNLVLSPGQTLHISVRVTQPTPDIFSYELDFI